MARSKSGKVKAAFRLVIIIQIFITGYLYAQGFQKDAKNVLYIEGLGNAGVYSLNYERSFKENVNVRIGFGYSEIVGETTVSDTIVGQRKEKVNVRFGASPVMVNYFIGKGDHKIEIGGGITLFVISAQSSEISSNGLKFKAGVLSFLTGTIGWRYQPKGGGLVFKVAFTPFYNFSKVLPFGGISVGYAF
jgi:hypothetical protein